VPVFVCEFYREVYLRIQGWMERLKIFFINTVQIFIMMIRLKSDVDLINVDYF